MNISTYFFGTYNNHEPRRDRKLLLTKKELNKLLRATKETGNTIIPIKLFVTDKGLAKLEIGLARGKKMYDKRQTLKETREGFRERIASRLDTGRAMLDMWIERNSAN